MYVSNTTTAANGFYSTGTFGGSFTDGIVMDYVQGTVGNGRLSVGVNDAITFYTGGLGATPTAYFDPNLRVGLGTTSPNSNLQVVGNVYASNAVTTTNIFGNTLTLSNAMSTLNVVGSVIASTLYGSIAGSNVGAFSNLVSANALVTTNLFANTLALSNATSTLNVVGSVIASTFYGSIAGSNVGAFSNLVSANALVTTNLIANTLTMSNATSTLNVIGSVIASTFYGVVAGSNTGSFLSVSANTLTLSNAAASITGNLYVSNALSSANAFLSGNLNVQQTANIFVANIANIYTTNIVGFVGSQWTGQIGSTIYYINPVGIGTSVSTSNLTVTGNIYVSNAIYTSNLILGGLTTGGFLQAQGAGNVASVSTIPIGSGGTNQTTYGTTGGILYYDGTRFQAASGITASTASTLNVTTANITTVQTNSFIPAASGIFMNLTATYTLTNTSNWLGNIAGTITSNLYTLFAPLPGTSGWNTYGSSALVNPPTVNGGIRFNQPGPYVITTVISADSGLKTIALSSNLGNTVDIHSNVTNVWQYCYRFPFGDVNPWPVTIPVYVTSTSQYYYIDYETNNQTDNIHQTAYTNAAAQAYTGSYVIIRPV